MSEYADFAGILNEGYKKSNKRKFTPEGYQYDSELSNHNQQVYYHPEHKKLIVNVTGTHNLKDVGTDLLALGGGLKYTGRYKSANRTAERARKKYQPSETTVTGHSLGGAIASRIAKDDEKIRTLNKLHVPLSKLRKNEKHVHVKGDFLTNMGPATKTVKRKKGAGLAHSIDNIKNLDVDI